MSPHSPQIQPPTDTFSARPVNERLRIAVIGAGLASTPHFLSLADLASEVEVAWVYGRSAERLSSVVTPGAARKTSRLEDILEALDVGGLLGDDFALNLAGVLSDVFEAKISNWTLERLGKHGLICFSK